MRLVRKRLGTLAASVLFAAGALMVSLAPGAASSGTTLTTTGGSAAVGSSFTTSASVSLAGGDELNAFEVTLTYVPGVAVPTGITLNGAWTIPLDAGTIGVGTVHVAASRLGFCSATCPLFTVSWSAVGAGSFQATPSSYVLSGRENGIGGNLSNTAPSAGVISVSGPATSTPVPPATNTPTSPATNTPTARATNTAAATSTSTTSPANTAIPTNTPRPTTAAPSATTTPPAPAATAIPASSPPAAEPTTAGAAPIVNDPPGGPGNPPAGNAGMGSPQPTAAAGQPPVQSTNPPSGSAAPPGAFIPLPPRTGTGPGNPTSFPWRPFGWGLMVVAAGLIAFDYSSRRKGRDGRFAQALDGYFDGLQSRGGSRE